MTRRLRRTSDFEVVLQVNNDSFINPPRESQRNWLLNRALNEFVDDITQLDVLARRFVPGAEVVQLEDRTNAPLRDDEIMEDWQIPIMRAMAAYVTESHGDILEVGFGRGLSATYIQEAGVRSHTIIECNDSVVDRYFRWKEQYPGRDIRLIHAKWQDATEQLGLYDGIFFHTYPLNEEDFVEQVAHSVTFAAHFFPTAAAHLRKGGVFTYLTNEIDSLSRGHQRLVFRYFSSFTASLVRDLELTEDSKDSLWADSMVVIKAVR
jgi:guanidinoacetate N-methyltransferase